MNRPHIAIIGAGFGGVYVARLLIPYVKSGLIDVTIINRTNHFLFTPLLHEVATGGLSPTSVTEPLREIFEGTQIQVIQGEIEYVDVSKKKIGLGLCEINYDFVVMATGAESNFYGISGTEEHALSLKSLSDAVKIRSAVIDAFEKACLLKNPIERSRALSFVVVGGGATGVEVAGELTEFVFSTAKRYYQGKNDCTARDISVTLINSSEEVLGLFHPSLRRRAKLVLSEKGVLLRLGVKVKAINKNNIVLEGGESIGFGVVIWTAGVKVNLPEFRDRKLKLISGRVLVNSKLMVASEENLFALGDGSAFLDEKSGEPIPMFAQVTVAQAKVVARNLMALIRGEELDDFKYRRKGDLVSLGQWFALGDIFGIRMSGRFTWWLWRTIYLFKFISWRKRLKIVFEWTINIFYPRDITKLN
jgi:NADH dehydrogenase